MSFIYRGALWINTKQTTSCKMSLYIGFKPIISSKTPTNSKNIDPKAKRKKSVAAIFEGKTKAMINIEKAAAKYTATPPKTGTSVVWDFLADGESVIFFANANLRTVGTKYIERTAAKNWAKNPYNKISFDM